MLGKTICWLQPDFQKKDICLKTGNRCGPRELYQVFLHQCYNNDSCHMLLRFLTDVARMLQAVAEWLFNSSSTAGRISGTSCWVLNWKGTSLLVDRSLQKAHKKLERWVNPLFKSGILRVTALVKGDRKSDSAADWHIKIEFAYMCFHCWKTLYIHTRNKQIHYEFQCYNYEVYANF